MYYPRVTKVIIHHFLTQDKTVSWRNKIGMHTSKDDYLINTLRLSSAKEYTQKYGAITSRILTSPEYEETKATDFTLIIPLVTSKGTSVKPVVPDVTEEESFKSKAESWGNDKDDSNNEQDSSGEDSDQKNDSDDDKTQSENENEFNSEHETDENESGSECDQEENKEDEDDEEEVKDELVKTPSNDSDDEDETKITDKAEGDEDEKMDYTTIQLYNDVDIRLNELVDTDKGFVQEEDIPYTDAEIVSPMDVHVHHEVPSKQTPTLLTIPISVISDTSPVYSTVIPQSLPSFTPPPQQSTSTQPPTTEAKNPLYTLPNFASVIQFNNRVTALEKEVVELKKDPLHTQVTALVDDHLDARLGETRDEFLNFLSVSLTTRITKQVQNQLPQISPEKAAATLTEFELKKILIDKMDKSESYLAALKHRECYEGLMKSYDLDKTIFSTYDRGLKKRKTSKDAEPTKGPKAKESQSGSSKSTKSQSKSSRKFVQSEELEFEVLDSDMPQDQKENSGKDDEEPKEKVASKRDWFTKLTQPQEPTDPDWNVDKTPQQGKNQSWLMTLASSAKKSSKIFDELMSTLIDFSTFIMNGLKINNLTQETLLGPAFRLLKGTRSNYAELEYDFEECYNAPLEKLDWENPKGSD
ncbi:hypothetical protein Tco_1306882, partial [Tanacetum coccineum]